VPTTLTNDILVAAIEGFEVRKRNIEDKIAEIRQMLIGGPTEPSLTPEAPAGNRKKFSAAARKKMARAQKERWARIKGKSEQPSPAVPVVPTAKRQISADGLKRISAAQKQRWAEKKAKAAEAQAPAKKAAGKKTATKKVAPVKKTGTKKAAAKKTAPVLAQAAG
jgi:hypothetical protein